MEQSVNERVKQICDFYFSGNTSAMSRSISVKQSTIRDIIGSKQSKPSFETLKAIVDCPSINVNAAWLISGAGNVYDETTGCFFFDFENETPEVTHIPARKKNTLEQILTTNEVGTPLLPIEAWGGSLSGSSISVLAEQCKKYNVPISNIDYLIPIAGESMMPDYCPGDVVGIKKINESAFIEWGKVYVLDTCNGVVIKEVQPSDNEGCITCISRNAPTKYKPFDISLNPEHFYGMYAVKGTVRIS